ncbi:uncharacterized protein PgNI_09562 [Pyricularia grisea]|uniref:Uncharacterized protein n=1 Tax=Pyricularia grisea TaxID=148305 RepID=A0A6P8ATS4_PYRGI|nr:uncharacterized protein PgNI_09562 [Pyricularia grisea]TLD05508.1 hypothetical protein PgNI_09562 [Pyricularia grisea]
MPCAQAPLARVKRKDVVLENWRLETAVWIRQCHRSTNPDTAADVDWYYIMYAFRGRLDT